MPVLVGLALTAVIAFAAANPEAACKDAPRAPSLLAIAKSHSSGRTVDPEVQLRPSEGGAADVVQFSILIKNFLGLDFPGQTWKADVVITLSWQDDRAKRLLPPGHDNVTVSATRAAEELWTPDVVVTNIDLQGDEVISTSFNVNKQGLVSKTQRVLAQLVANYDVSNYPYDIQKLEVMVASGTYMSDEVQMQAMGQANAADGAFSEANWILSSMDLSTKEEMDSSLSKSRGLLQLNVQHDPAGVFSSCIIPEILILVLSYTVFLMPNEAAFVMPRVATGMISFLSLLTLSQQTLNALPPRSGICWLELFDASCRFLVFITVILNLFVEVIYYTWGCKEMSTRIATQIMILYPIVSMFILGLVAITTERWYLTLATFQRTFVTAGCVIYMVVWSKLAGQHEEKSIASPPSAVKS